MKKTISQPVLEVLKQATVNGRVLVLNGQLERKLYVETNKVLEMLGGKWDRKAKGHTFAEDASEIVDGAVLSGEVVDLKQLYQFFETPAQVARDMIRHACMDGGNQRVLEPSAGNGAIVREVLLNWSGPAIDVAELEPKRNAALATMPRVRVIGSDFLSLPIAADTYDRIIANPPFRAGQDVRHVRRMFEVLKPGGILVSVMSPSWQYRSSGVHKEFRDWFEGLPNAEADPLDNGSFSASGTAVNTVLVRIIK